MMLKQEMKNIGLESGRLSPARLIGVCPGGPAEGLLPTLPDCSGWNWSSKHYGGGGVGERVGGVGSLRKQTFIFPEESSMLLHIPHSPSDVERTLHTLQGLA